MDVFTMVAIIVVAACGSGVARSYLKSRAGKDRAAVDEGVAKALADLRTRVEVLERIVTDGKHDLAREINALGPGERPA